MGDDFHCVDNFYNGTAILYTYVCLGGDCERVRLYMLDCTELCNKMSFAL